MGDASWWKATKKEEISLRVVKNGLGGAGVDIDDSAGHTADFIAFYEAGAGRTYLQADLSTFTATEHRHPFTWDGEKWDDGIDFVVPINAIGRTLIIEKTLWDAAGNIVHVTNEEHYVSAVDLDDIEQQVISPEESERLVFRRP